MTVDGTPAPEKLDPPPGSPYPGLASLQGADILRAQAEGSAEALEATGVPVLRWSMPRLDEHELGAFTMAWQAIVGLLGMVLDLDPFDQPGWKTGRSAPSCGWAWPNSFRSQC